ncbi:PilN domain-containing protein [Uliginosibacterium paludis]|uniref:PilN domain-containing protein n=1 Tax=Uliginosibacterium paludis TaxID=1615952 RepID=A0ABV2CVU0_9RHOO
MMFARRRKTGSTPWQLTTQPGMALALRLAAPHAGEKPRLLGLKSDESAHPPAERLEALAAGLGLRGDSLHLLLEPGSYQFLQSEVPQVPAEELKTALRWTVKDMLSQPLDDTTFDALLPVESAQRAAMAYVAAAPNVLIRARMLMFRPWSSAVEQIGVAETAQRSVADALEESGRATAVLAITPTGCMLTASHAGELFFVRNFDLSCLSLNASESVRRDQFDRLVLELQRSFDVLERQFSSRAISTLWISPFAHAEELLGLLVESLYLPVRIINLAELVDTRECPLPVNPDAQAALFHLLGFALGSQAVGRQTLDLVNPALLPPKPFFQFRTMSLSVLVVACVLALIAVFIHSSLAGYVSVADDTRARRVAREAQVKAQSAKLTVRKSDPLLAEELERVRGEVQRLRRVESTVLTPASQTAAAGASLGALSAAVVDGVWLRQIEFSNGRLSVEGYATQAERIPLYLERLQAQPAFAGQRFESFELGRERFGEGAAARDALVFKLQSGEGKKP